MKDAGADNAHGGEDEGDGNDPKCHDTDGQEFRRRIEKAHELCGKDLEDKKAQAHKDQGHFVGQLDDFVDPFSVPGAVIIGDNGNQAVVHAEDGHEDKALHFKVDSQGHHGGGTECGEDGVDKKDGDGVDGDHNGRGNAYGQNAFDDFTV